MLLKKWRGLFNRSTPAGSVPSLEYRACGALRKSETSRPISGDWFVPQNMEGLEYLLVEPACEVNKKGTREKNYSNEDVSMDDNERNFCGVEMIQSRTRYQS